MTLEEAAAEEPSRRRLFLGLALAVPALFLLALHPYWVPADSGVDENAYLVSGKLLARTGSPALVSPDPYALVGPMWIRSPEGTLYPKYPLGEPLLLAAAIGAFGPRAAFAVNPLLAALALLGVFLLIREVAGSWAGLLGMLAMAASPVVLAEANDPNSHASALCLTTWGMFLLLRWWRTGKLHHAGLAGLLLGLSAITRYTEGLLLLPLGIIALLRLGKRPWNRRDLAGAAVLMLAWSLPVACQLAFNLHALHSLTGYEATHESTDFSPGYLARNAGPAVRHLFLLGLPILLPVGALGLGLLTVRNRRLGLALWAWVLPGLLLYMSYYWAIEGIAYTRFFLTLLPPLSLGMAWLLTRPFPGRWSRPAALALVLACGAFGVWEVLPTLRDDQRDQLQTEGAGKAALALAPPGSAFFGPQSMLLYLQFMGDYQLYSRGLFVPRTIARLGQANLRGPNALQPERARALYRMLKGLKPAGLLRLERSLMARAIDQGRRVFLIVPAGEPTWTRFASPDLDARDSHSFVLRPVSHWAGWEGLDEPGGGKPMVWEMLEVTLSSTSAAAPP